MSAPPPGLPGGVIGWLCASRARWLAGGFLLCVALPPFFSWPALRPMPAAAQQAWRQYWADVVQRKVDHPLHDYTGEFPDESNQAKRNFRITVPLLAHATGLGARALPAVRLGLQAVLILCLLLAAEKACADRPAALGVALAVAGTYVGTSVWMDEWGWFDNCAHAFLAAALAAGSPALAAAAVVAGGFTDERTLLAVPLVMAFHAWTGGRRALVAAPLAGAGLYAAIRLVLALAAGLRTAASGIGTSEIVHANLRVSGLGAWSALEGGWVLLAGAGFWAWRAGRLPAWALLCAAALAPLAASAAVIDFSRSASYAFPASLASAALLAPAGPGARPPRRAVRMLAAAAAAVSLLSPNAFIMGQTFIQPSVLIRALSHRP
jgi:hypothetical protein